MTARTPVRRLNAIRKRYQAGETLTSIAKRFKTSEPHICRLARQHGFARDEVERSARISEHSRRINSDPRILASKRAKMREHYAAGRVGPKRPIFEHDPVKREAYLTLRDAMGAAYARQAMGLDA